MASHSLADSISFEPIREPLPYFDARPVYERWDPAAKVVASGSAAVTTAMPREFRKPLEFFTTRNVYPAEDRTIDAVVTFNKAEGFPNKLVVRVLNENGEMLVHDSQERVNEPQYFLSIPISASWIGRKLSLEVALISEDGKELEKASRNVEISQAVTPLSVTGIDIDVRDPLPGSPCRVGVPLPRGFLDDEKRLALFDAKGEAVPVDIRATGRWARFGSLKWVFLTFLNTGESRYHLRVGSSLPERDMGVRVGDNISISQVVELARKIADGDNKPSGAGIVDEEFLRGGFVEHAKGANYGGWHRETVLSPGQLYKVPASATWKVEVSSSQLIELRCEDWFEAEKTSEKFCQFVARLRIYPGSPFLDFEYTWIFTGDGNKDHIKSMGWNFGNRDLETPRFISSDLRGTLNGEYLVQTDSNVFKVRKAGKVVAEGNRSPGIAVGDYANGIVAMAVRDFWENFPSELGFPDGLTFYLWPKHGSERRNHLTLENAYKLWFAHEGEVLSFSLPQALTEAPFYAALSGVEPPFAHGLPESANAQGIAKTTEFRFYVGSATKLDAVADYFSRWNARASDPVVDPKWVEMTDVFSGMAALDRNANEAWEDDYALAAQWPGEVIDALDVYGKWIYGDIPMIGDLERRTVGLYRAYDKAHWGWPYSWVPYARSGEPLYRKLADAATRMMTDTAYCHYVSDDLADAFAKLPPRSQWTAYQPFRAKGWNNEGLIPWAGGYWGPTSRMYCDKVDHIFDSWHLTGYAPGLEVAKDWMQQTKVEQADKFGRGPIVSDPIRARWTDNLLRQYLACYEETFDPWFISAAHAIAEMHLWMETHHEWKGHFWQGGATDYLRYTRDSRYAEFYLRFARDCLEPSRANFWSDIAPAIQPGVFAYQWSGNPWFLRRAAAYPVMLHEMIRNEAEPKNYRGWLATGGTNEAGLFYGWYLRWAPQLFRVWNAMPSKPDPIPGGFFVKSSLYEDGEMFPEIALKFPNDGTAKIVMLNCAGAGARSARVKITDGSKTVVDVALKDGCQEIPIESDGDEFRLKIMPADAGKYIGFTLRLPVTRDNVAEVYRVPLSGPLPVGERNGAMWFVSSGEPAFSLSAKKNNKFPVRRASLWSDNGALLADVQFLNSRLSNAETIFDSKSAKTAVGELLKLSFPGTNESTWVRGAQTPWMAISKEKWFSPRGGN